MTDVYNEALATIRRHPGTGGASSLAKLVLSLYNDLCGFSFAECVGNLDDHNTGLAIRLVTDYAAHGETEELRQVGKVLSDDLYPGLWEMGVAMRNSRAAIREKWQVEEKAREAARIASAEKAFFDAPDAEGLPHNVAVALLPHSEDGLLDGYYYSGDWYDERLSVADVRRSITANGTMLSDTCIESPYMLAVYMNDRVYYVHTDYEKRQSYLDSLKSGTPNDK